MIKTKENVCEVCQGSGNTLDDKCLKCGGSGKIKKGSLKIDCPKCHGKGRLGVLYPTTCPACKGRKQVGYSK